MAEVVIPNSVVEIGESLFEGDVELKKVTLPGNFKKIITSRDDDSLFYYQCFRGCDSLKEIAISEGAKEIGDSAFDD